jgi:hypothetical protein
MPITIRHLAAACLAVVLLGCSGPDPGGPPAGAPLVSDGLLDLELAKPAPTRRAPRAAASQPAAFVPREVPRDLTAIVVVSIAQGGATLAQETFRLSRERVSVTSGNGAEWWLARNPLHHDELSGARVDPAERLVIEHTPGELRTAGCEDLWDRIAALGAPDAPSAPLAPTGRVEQAFGLPFEQWTAADESSAVREMWWCPEASLPLRVSLRLPGQEVVREIVALEQGVDPSALRHPSERHPGWRHRELSDLDDDAEHRGPPDHGASPGGATR